jgi:hypothetical protein
MAGSTPPKAPIEKPEAPEATEIDDNELERLRADLEEARRQLQEGGGETNVEPTAPAFTVPVAAADPNEQAGQRQNTNADLQPIRKDEEGRIWFQEEVRKPSFAKPRGRRVLTYTDTGSKVITTQGADGTTETFEVAGDQPRQSAQVKVTLPSYQVGLYKDPRFPFRIHIYNERRGFHLFDVADYFGGTELVPADIKRVYVENVLCYDMRTTIRNIQTEYRQLMLAGRIK